MLHSIKKRLIGGLVGLVMAVMPAHAEPSRRIELDFSSPLESVESSEKVVNSFTDAFGNVSDSNKSSLDDYFLKRLGVLVFQGYVVDFESFMAHEAAHNTKTAQNDHSVLGFYWPKIRKNYLPLLPKTTGNMDLRALNDDELILTIAAGLNQQEYIAAKQFERFHLDDRITFDKGLLYLDNKNAGWLYALRQQKMDRVKKPNDFYNGGGVADPDSYRVFLKQRGIKISNRKLLFEDVAASMVSLTNISSLIVVGQYLFKSNRSTDAGFVSYNDKNISLPEVSHYWLTNGTFANAEIFVKGEHMWKWSVGSHLDFVEDGKVNRYRAGAKVYDFIRRGNASLSPFFYASVNGTSDLKGVSTGVEANVELSKTLSLTGKIDYSKDDPIENEAKLRKEGVQGVVGLEWKF